MVIAEQVRQKLKKIELKVTPSKYAAANDIVEFYISFSKGNGYFNQLTRSRLQAIYEMPEEEMLANILKNSLR
jgi:hypothetical protein